MDGISSGFFERLFKQEVIEHSRYDLPEDSLDFEKSSSQKTKNLLALPMELRQSIFRRLSAEDLSVVTFVCPQLRLDVYSDPGCFKLLKNQSFIKGNQQPNPSIEDDLKLIHPDRHQAKRKSHDAQLSGKIVVHSNRDADLLPMSVFFVTVRHAIKNSVWRKRSIEKSQEPPVWRCTPEEADLVLEGLPEFDGGKPNETYQKFTVPEGLVVYEDYRKTEETDVTCNHLSCIKSKKSNNMSCRIDITSCKSFYKLVKKFDCNAGELVNYSTEELRTRIEKRRRKDYEIGRSHEFFETDQFTADLLEIPSEDRFCMPQQSGSLSRGKDRAGSVADERSMECG